MAKGSLNLLPVVREWWSRDGKQRPIIYVVLPIGVGVGVGLFKVQFTGVDGLQGGVMLLTAVLFDTLFHAYGWAEDAAGALAEAQKSGSITGAWQRERTNRRLRAVGRLYHTLAWATLVALTLTISLVLMNTEVAKGSALPTVPRSWATCFVAVVATHLVMVLLTAVARVFRVAGSTIKEQESKAGKRAA